MPSVVIMGVEVVAHLPYVGGVALILL